MTMESTQAEAMTLLQAAYERARAVVTPELLDVAERRIRATLTHQSSGDAISDPALRDAIAIVDQMLMDVSQLDDATVTTAGQHFSEGGLADFVMASYVIEARTRLAIATDRLWPRGQMS